MNTDNADSFWRAIVVTTMAGFLLTASSQRTGAVGDASISDARQYDALSRPIVSGPIAGTRQLLFAIDRQAEAGRRVHWIDTKANPLHIDWFGPMAMAFKRYEDFTEETYRSDDRRWILGSVVRHPEGPVFAVEFWDGDTATAAIVAETMRELSATFPFELSFTPTSELLERSANIAKVRTLSPQDAYGNRDEMVFNPGVAVGTLRFVKDGERLNVLPTDIVVLERTPVFLDPVAGIVTMKATTPLSHVSMLATMWDVPNAQVRTADRWKDLDGRTVVLAAGKDGVSVRVATGVEIAKAAAVRQIRTPAPVLPLPDMAFAGMPSLSQVSAKDSIRIGAKAANLGDVAAVANASQGRYAVPPGFSLPFRYYEEHLRRNRLDGLVSSILTDPEMRTDRNHARARLDALRKAIETAPMDQALMRSITARRAQVVGVGGVFARSSTNSEDLPGFNGAGLYTSVPNLVSEEDLSKATRRVWASIWNDRAFFAREAARIDHSKVRAAVLIQKAIASDSSGVLITAEPGSEFGDEDAVTINAKRGLGERVVEGVEPAEQLVYRTSPYESVRIVARSMDGRAVVLEPKGGVREIVVQKGTPVLTDAQTRMLGRAGNDLKRHFGRPQDAEWAFSGGRLWMLQSRPYLMAGRRR
jgi:hypothetical protein